MFSQDIYIIGIKGLNDKFESGEIYHDFNTYSPYYLGIGYGDKIKLGGEDKFLHCCDFYSGGGGFVDFWIAEELSKLTHGEKQELNFILKRNKEFELYKQTKVIELSKVFDIQSCDIYRMPNSLLYQMYIFFNPLPKAPRIYPKVSLYDELPPPEVRW